MSCLVLRLAGPLQAWGSRSRFVRRETEPAPTKSGVIGLLAAARGRYRSNDLSEFSGLRFGVRIDQPGRLLGDFQTARRLDGSGKSMPLSYRQYVADAVFVAAIEGDAAYLAELDAALRRPHFPLFLGRRSCPPVPPLSLGLWEGSLRDVLRDVNGVGVPWQAARWYRRRRKTEALVQLEILRDLEPNETPAGRRSSEPDLILRDVPLSFDPVRREYGWRSVVREHVEFANPDHDVTPADPPDHEPLSALGA